MQRGSRVHLPRGQRRLYRTRIGIRRKTFKTKQLAKADLKSNTFKQFAVVWWHEGDTDPGHCPMRKLMRS